MGRIVASVSVASFSALDKALRLDALVDTGATYLTLPLSYKNRLGELEKLEDSVATLADGNRVMCEICGPVRIVIEGFSPIYSSVMFMDDTKTDAKTFEPLLGYIPLEQSRVAVDMLGHRLLKAEAFDLKNVRT